MQHLSGMDRARSALERGDRVPAGTLQPIVADSWQRCRDADLDPRGRPRQSVVALADVKRRREANAAMRLLALAEMQLLYSQIAGSNFMIALGDADGIVLDTISDQQFADSSAGRSIIPGSMWNESERGTNALGLAGMTGKPVAIYGREHYFACHGHLSCMAAPIFNSAGEILGLLDASCAHEARQEHTHALVRMAAAQIENGLIYQDSAKSFVLAFHPRAEYLDTLSAGLLSVSLDGEVLSINRPGKSLLAGLPATPGNRFDGLFEAGFGTAIDGLLNGGVIRLRDRAGSVVFMVCRQIGERRTAIEKRSPPTVPVLLRQEDAPDFVVDDPQIKRSLIELAEAAALCMPVHIAGETGTGKELMARHVHRLSGRKGEFVAVNCGAVPEDLFIAEIFGHEGGAFTNARAEGSPGLARTADRGTLFLDEVADIPIAAQTSLLRFLDSMEIRAVGGQKMQKVDVQIVSATNRDLENMVAQRQFRADLYYRLNSFHIRLPPLRSRTDFGSVVRFLMGSMAPGTPVTDAAIMALSRRQWPGNIRELKTVLRRALLRRRADYIDEGCFDEAEPVVNSLWDCCEECRGRPLSRTKCQEIRTVYQRTGENVSRTARELGVSRTTVYKHVGTNGSEFEGLAGRPAAS
ncbi:sigma-54-dependent Fis family transcriptional regulator (plasmid) [Rhizobium sp. CB3060]|uniref:sigma-54-dependent Fis family transcriptional regulator n=1 Tax=Rhizobium sp. CB3060 TaxID=3138255 RepID=UPI0021A33850|nr:sigma-54-dependent Fis family transcriptional regulator [Rhizobium tropici]UWU24315.1 sigma-54-dependent Fis family transcriptional regulator [Rhizobium tropici]